MIDKIKKVKNILKNKKIVIAFSGGADSTLITYLASQVCDNPLAITINNHLMPRDFIRNTQEICQKFKIEQKIIDIDFYKNNRIIKNPYNRCYLCRDEMYKLIQKEARREGYHIIIDGTNISDLVRDRPGILINYKNNIKSPFVDAKLTSCEINKYLENNDIRYCRSTTCLATRIPFNQYLTPEKLRNIDLCERVIYNNTNCGIVKFRSRADSMHIIEVDHIKELLDENKLDKIKNELKDRVSGDICLNLSEIDNNEDIILDYKDNGFIYNLPYNIDLDKTKIESDKITIKRDGTVIGDNFNSYHEALNEFMNVLPQIRRTLA